MIVLKFLLLFKNFAFISCRTLGRPIPSWILERIENKKDIEKIPESNFQSSFITETTEYFSPWPETSSTAYISTLFHTWSSAGFESQWVLYNVTGGPPSNEAVVSEKEPLANLSVSTQTSIMAETTPRIFQILSTVDIEAEYKTTSIGNGPVTNGVHTNIEQSMLSFSLIFIMNVS